MTQEEKNALIKEAALRYPKGTRFISVATDAYNSLNTITGGSFAEWTVWKGGGMVNM